MMKEDLVTKAKYALRFLSDEKYINLYYKLRVKRKLDLKNPHTLNEKIQWLKFCYRHPLMSVVSDKYLVRDYISQKIGDEYLIPLLGVWESFDEIDFDKLPDQFVLKCNHDSGGIIVCKDKRKLDKAAAKKKIEKSLKTQFFYVGRESQYRFIKPKIIAEQFIGVDGECPSDYKIYCFNGKPDVMMICKNRFSQQSHRAEYVFYDRDWNFLRYQKVDQDPNYHPHDEKPENLDEMYEIAKKLSTDFLFARVDLYNVNGKIYFGEITLSPNSGFDPDLTYEADKIFGDKLEIPYLKDLTWR